MELTESLNEHRLGKVLDKLYPNEIFIHDRIVPNSNIRNRADYYSEKLKLIFEYDGPTHYTKSDVILKDYLKDKVYSELGYKVIRIPYFIEIPNNFIFYEFDIDYELDWNYPSGFIYKDVVLPADYCQLGIERFKNNLNKYFYLNDIIVDSLKIKIQEKKDIRLVLPESLFHIV